MYERGALKLLDQLKLPLETTYVDVEDCDACWRAIKDMNVRGAPAIAIAAALALAVELEKKKGSSRRARRRRRSCTNGSITCTRRDRRR